MELPRVTVPLLMLMPKAEEANFWHQQYPQLRLVDGGCVAYVFLMVFMVHFMHLGHYRDFTELSQRTRLGCETLMAAAVLQAAVMCAFPDWWRRHRRYVCIANRALHTLVFVPAWLGICYGQPPWEAALRLVCRDLLHTGCGTSRPLSAAVTIKILCAIGLLPTLWMLPFLFPLRFAESALLQVLAGVTFSWVAAVPTAAAAAVDPRLVSHSRAVCVGLGRIATHMSALVFGPVVSPVEEQCAYGGMPLLVRQVLMTFGVLLPLAVSWVAEWHWKCRYVLYRRRRLGAAGEQAGGWFLVDVAWVVAVLYVTTWHVLALIPG